MLCNNLGHFSNNYPTSNQAFLGDQLETTISTYLNLFEKPVSFCKLAPI